MAQIFLLVVVVDVLCLCSITRTFGRGWNIFDEIFHKQNIINQFQNSIDKNDFIFISWFLIKLE